MRRHEVACFLVFMLAGSVVNVLIAWIGGLDLDVDI